MRGVIVKDSGIPPSIPRRPLGIADITGATSSPSSSKSYSHATTLTTVEPEIVGHGEQGYPSPISKTRVIVNLGEPEAPRNDVLESLGGDDYGLVVSTTINLGFRTDKSKNISSSRPDVPTPEEITSPKSQ